MSASFKFALLGFCLPGFVLVGCKSENTYENDKTSFHAQVIKGHRIETDGFLAEKAKVLEIREGVAQGDLMKIDVEILNDNLWEGNIDYKFEWFDEQGMIVESPTSAWVTQHLGAKEKMSLISVAPTPTCKDFRLKLQRNLRF